MSIQRVSLLFGAVFVLVAVLGFVATGLVMPGMHDSMSTAPLLLGLFPVNVAHNLVHLAFGVWGLTASRSARASMLFAMTSGALYLVLAGAGLYVPDGFGIVPLGGYDVALHAAIAVVLIGFGLLEALRPGAPVAKKG